MDALTDERWREIERDNTMEHHGSANAVKDIAELLAEIKRLRTELANKQFQIDAFEFRHGLDK